MDPAIILAIAMAASREIREWMKTNKEISDEQMAKIIATNLIKINLAVEQIQAEIQQYGG